MTDGSEAFAEKVPVLVVWVDPIVRVPFSWCSLFGLILSFGFRSVGAKLLSIFCLPHSMSLPRRSKRAHAKAVNAAAEEQAAIRKRRVDLTKRKSERNVTAPASEPEPHITAPPASPTAPTRPSAENEAIGESQPAELTPGVDEERVEEEEQDQGIANDDKVWRSSRHQFSL